MPNPENPNFLSKSKFPHPENPNPTVNLTNSSIFKENPSISPLSKISFSQQIRQWPAVMRWADVGLAGYRSAGINNESKPQGASAGIAKRNQFGRHMSRSRITLSCITRCRFLLMATVAQARGAIELVVPYTALVDCQYRMQTTIYNSFLQLPCIPTAFGVKISAFCSWIGYI